VAGADPRPPFAGQFKRQTPVGRHIPDFVPSCIGSRSNWSMPTSRRRSSPTAPAGKAWLEARDYRVIEMRVGDVEGDLATELGRLEACLSERG
jgi:tRNA/rRNA methyltransferase